MSDVTFTAVSKLTTFEVIVHGAAPIEKRRTGLTFRPSIVHVTYIAGQWTRLTVTGPVVEPPPGPGGGPNFEESYTPDSCESMPDWAWLIINRYIEEAR